MPKNPWLDDEAWNFKVLNKRSLVVLIGIVLACLALFGIMGA